MKTYIVCVGMGKTKTTLIALTAAAGAGIAMHYFDSNYKIEKINHELKPLVRNVRTYLERPKESISHVNIPYRTRPKQNFGESSISELRRHTYRGQNAGRNNYTTEVANYPYPVPTPGYVQPYYFPVYGVVPACSLIGAPTPWAYPYFGYSDPYCYGWNRDRFFIWGWRNFGFEFFGEGGWGDNDDYGRGRREHHHILPHRPFLGNSNSDRFHGFNYNRGGTIHARHPIADTNGWHSVFHRPVEPAAMRRRLPIYQNRGGPGSRGFHLYRPGPAGPSEFREPAMPMPVPMHRPAPSFNMRGQGFDALPRMNSMPAFHQQMGNASAFRPGAVPQGGFRPR